MTIGWQEQLQTRGALREIVQQATAALIRMDSGRLEELAQCCVDLNREIQQSTPAAVEEQGAVRDTACDAEYDLQLLERILFETRANLTVFSRLHVIRLREAGLLAQEPGLYCAGTLSGTSSQERKAVYGDN